MATRKSPKVRPVKVLSIRQPYADLILAGPRCHIWKWAENRNWRTRHRGELFIHASRLEARPANAPDEVREFWDGPGDRTVGAIIGRVELLDVIFVNDLEDVYWKLQGRSQRRMSDQQQRLFELLRDVPEASWDHVVGAHCFILWNPRRLKRPIPTGGKLGVWPFNLPVNLE